MFKKSLPRVAHILVEQCSNKIRTNSSVREMFLLASFDAVVDDVGDDISVAITGIPAIDDDDDGVDIVTSILYTLIYYLPHLWLG